MLEHVTTIWADKLALVSPEERRKLCALGLAHLCGSGWPPVMKVWPSAISAIVEVVYDVTMEDSNQDKLVRLLDCCRKLHVYSGWHVSCPGCLRTPVKTHHSIINYLVLSLLLLLPPPPPPISPILSSFSFLSKYIF